MVEQSLIYRSMLLVLLVDNELIIEKYLYEWNDGSDQNNSTTYIYRSMLLVLLVDNELIVEKYLYEWNDGPDQKKVMDIYKRLWEC